MKRKGTGEGGFGVSLLDLLCSSMGAVVLLIMLNNVRATTELKTTRVAMARIRSQNQAMKQTASTFEDQAARIDALANQMAGSPAPIQADWSSRLQLMPQGLMKNLVIILDVSGSMSRYYPDTAKYSSLPASLKVAGPKWQQTVRLVEKILATSSSLEHFVILRLDDNREGHCGEQLVPVRAGRWLPDADASKAGNTPVAMIETIGRTVATLSKINPAGGSSHGDAIQQAFRYIDDGAFLQGGPAADTVILITDGLPNHGDAPGEVSHPPSGTMVSAASKNARRLAVTDKVENTFREWRRAGKHPNVRFHVICLPWPDDIELQGFALDLARPSQGLVLFLPQEPIPSQ